jgi:hypothetical protein
LILQWAYRIENMRPFRSIHLPRCCMQVSQPTPAGGLDFPDSLCSNLLCDSSVSALSNDLLHTSHLYCCLFGLFLAEDDKPAVLALLLVIYWQHICNNIYPNALLEKPPIFLLVWSNFLLF